MKTRMGASPRFMIVLACLLSAFPALSSGDNAGAKGGAAWTLKDIYAAALKNSERIAVSEQSVRRAEALYRQTMGSAFPDLSFQHQTLWQDRTGSRATQSPQSQGSFQILKTGLTGYRELAALRAGRSTIREAEFARMQVERLLLSDIASAYFGFVQSGENLSSTQRLINLSEARLRELDERVRVGRSRKAEAIEQQYQIVTLESQAVEVARSVAADEDLLSYLAGAPVRDVDRTGVSTPTVTETLPARLSRVESRPDVRTARAAADAARGAVDLARGEYLPQIALGFNAYTYRPDAYKNINWDASVGVGVPLWAWGARRNAVRAAQASLAINEQELKAALRQADLDVRNAYRDLTTALRQLELHTQAVGLARRDYEIQLRDDRQGLVTNLDVLESLNRLNAAELALINSRVQARQIALTLEIASGATPEEALK
jgi:outer membrane protein TolC